MTTTANSLIALTVFAVAFVGTKLSRTPAGGYAWACWADRQLAAVRV